MSGGHLAVLDRLGREVKQYALDSGLATLGSSASCDIRFMLPTVEPHHATLVVHDKQTVVHNVGCGQTLVNGAAVSVAPLAHGDVLALGGRELRWRYTRSAPHSAPPSASHTAHAALTPVVSRMSGVRARVAARRSLAAARAPRSPHRHSTPASARQVAVVQPQRRDAADNTVESVADNVRRRGTSRSDQDASSSGKSEEAKGRSKLARTPQMNLQNTKASLWIESRKSSPRRRAKEGAGPAAGRSAGQSAAPVPRRPRSARGAPLRVAVLRRARSAPRLTKIQAPRTVDHTKQAAIMLMTGHTPKQRANPKTSGARTPSLLVKRPGAAPARRAPRTSHAPHTPADDSARTPPAAAAAATSPQLVHTSDISTYSVPDVSPPLRNPKKSALKNSSVNRSARKIESIKFDFSNLEDAASVDSSAGELALSLHYSDSSPDSAAPSPAPSLAPAPSPRQTVRAAPHSRSSRMLEKTLGTTFTRDTPRASPAPSPSPSTTANRSTRGSIMVHKVLQTQNESCSYRSTGSLADLSWDTTAPSASPAPAAPPACDTGTLSPRNCSNVDNKMESYSVIDLVSMDSSDPCSVYSSASDVVSSKFTTPQSTARSPHPPRMLAASTPAAPRPLRPSRPRSAAAERTDDTFHNSTLLVSRRSKSAADSPYDIPLDATYNISGRGRTRSPIDIDNIPDSTRNTRHLNTPPGQEKQNVTHDNDTSKFSSPNNTGGTFNISDKSRTKSFSTLNNSSENVASNITSDSRVSKSSRSRGGEDGSSPSSVASSSRRPLRSSNAAGTPSSPPAGMSTPENHNSPEEASTPVLSIQSLLNASRKVSPAARRSAGGRLAALRKRVSLSSKSFTFGTRAALRSRNSKNTSSSADIIAGAPRGDGDVTPKKTVKLVYEAVKNKHSTAKRPTSIKSVIDDLNDSDIIKQLFSSPVKRKLSQSMIEFSKRNLMDDETTPPRKTTRNTIALTGITSHSSSAQGSPAATPHVTSHVTSHVTPHVTPDVFVSPLTASGSGDRGVSSKLRRWREGMAKASVTRSASSRSRLRKSAKNKSANVSGIKRLFARSPRNRLSDVRIKELFAISPRNDLRRVPKLRLLFQKSPESEMRNVSGVRELYRKRSPADDLRNVSGVRATMRRRSPRNDLDDVSGVEELFAERADADADTSFDLLMGRPAVRAYPRAKSFTAKLIQKPKTRKAQSLLNSFTLINDNVEYWLETELRKRTHKESSRDAPGKRDTSSRQADAAGGRTPINILNKSNSKSNLSRELLKLATDTVEGGSPVLARRGRSGAPAKTSLLELKKSASEIYEAHMLPIKKRSVVETSRSRSGRSGRSGGHKSSLPIKKRAVQHSTPVRRAPARLAALVSPIAPTAPTAPTPTRRDNLALIQIPRERMKRKTLQTRNANDAGDNNDKYIAMSDKLAPKQLENIITPLQIRNTRNRKTNHNIEQNNVKKRRTSIVVTKKPPGLSPKQAARETGKYTEREVRTSRRRKLGQVQENLTTNVAAAKTRGKRSRAETEANLNGGNGNKGRNAKASDKPKESPPQGRTTRRRKASAEKVQTPKKMTRTKVLKQTVVVTKPSPKTRTAKQSKVNVCDRSPVKNLRRTRKTNANETDPPAEIANRRGRRGKAAAAAAAAAAAVKQTGSKKTKAKNNSYNEDLNADPKPRRGKKTIAHKNVQDELSNAQGRQVQKRATRNTVNVVENVNKKTRGRAAVPQGAIEPLKRRANKGNMENIGRGNKRRAANEQSPSIRGAANTKVADKESVNSVRRVAKGRQAQAQGAAGAVKTQATANRRGRSRSKVKEVCVEAASDVHAARGSKDTAKKKLLAAAASNANTRVAHKPRAAPPARKRKADDPAPAKAGPSAPKTRRAAADSPRAPPTARTARTARPARPARSAPAGAGAGAGARSRRR